MQVSNNILTQVGAEISTIIDWNYLEYMKPENNEWMQFVEDRGIQGREDREIFWDDIITLEEVGEYDPIGLKNILGNDYLLETSKRTLGIRVPKQDWSRWKEKINQKAALAGRMVSLIPRDDICDILNLGDTTKYIGYDGVPIFSNAHPKGGTTYSNLETRDLNETNLGLALSDMSKIPSDDGIDFPLDIAATHLVVGSELKQRVWTLINSTTTTVANQFYDNPFNKRLTSVVSSKLIDPYDWWLLAVPETTGQKPFIFVRNNDFWPIEVRYKDDEIPGWLVWKGEGFAKTWPSHPYLMQKNIGSA